MPSVCCQRSDSKHWENLPFPSIGQFFKMAYRTVCFLPRAVNTENLKFWFKGKRNLNPLPSVGRKYMRMYNQKTWYLYLNVCGNDSWLSLHLPTNKMGIIE